MIGEPHPVLEQGFGDLDGYAGALGGLRRRDFLKFCTGVAATRPSAPKADALPDCATPRAASPTSVEKIGILSAFWQARYDRSTFPAWSSRLGEASTTLAGSFRTGRHALGLSPSLGNRIAEAATAPGRPPVIWLFIWLSAQECTGCTESLLRAHHPTVETLIDVIAGRDHLILIDVVERRFF